MGPGRAPRVVPRLPRRIEPHPRWWVRLLLLCLVWISILGGRATRAETGPEAGFYERTLEAVDTAAGIADPGARTAALDQLWTELEDAGRFPLIEGERCTFLFRGQARRVELAGDFNGWDPAQSPARRLGESEVWLFETRFPIDARLDYKFVVDGGDWRLDPSNPRTQLGGFGPNSELRMPDYQASPWLVRADGVPRGSIQGPRSLRSEHLGYAVRFAVYLPADYDELEDLPCIYVTDGHEYADDAMGGMVLVLDNLIAQGRIEPVMAVFVDPRVDGRNLRAEQYVLNPSFADFAAEELVPLIDGDYRSSPHREDRAILGTSLGGLNAAWFGYRHPESFGLVAMQSPAFQAGGGRILDLYRESEPLELRMFMSWGSFHDFGENTEQMLDILRGKGYELATELRNEGHSWGQWRALLDEILLYFWARD